MIASLPLAVAACAPPVASQPTASEAIPLPAASVSPSAAAAPEVRIVEPPFRRPQEWAYAPTELSVKVGSRVIWTNTGAVAHTATADDEKSFDSGTIDPRATFTLVPQSSGTFAYHCTFHPWMKATLIVTS